VVVGKSHQDLRWATEFARRPGVSFQVKQNLAEVTSVGQYGHCELSSAFFPS
jgi:hypothetical protein